MEIGTKFGIAGCLLLALGGVCFTLVYQQTSWIWGSIQGIAGVHCLLVGLFCMRIYFNRPARSHSLKSLLSQHITNEVFLVYGNYLFYRKLPQWGASSRKVQDALLMNILHHNQNTQYGLDHNFAQITSRDAFVKCHPLTDYSHYKDYVDNVVNGEENVLFADKVAHIAYTSGTTGKNKLFPLNATLKRLVSSTLFMRPMTRRSEYGLGRVVGLRHRPPARKSSSGVPIAPWSYYAAPVLPFFLVPPVAHEIAKEEASLYTQGLFALAEEQVTMIDGFMATFCYSFFLTLERHWRQMCEDLENGYIWEDLDIEPEIRSALDQHLVANSRRAQKVREAFEKGMDGIAKRVWPEIKAVHMVASGSFKVYTDSLMSCHTKGLRLLSVPHGASEGLVGVSLADDPRDMSYVIQPTSIFFEFIPENEIMAEQPRTVLMDELEVGKSYEVVMTTRCGLYRYRLGDFIKIVGSVQNCPKYEFVYRIGQALNLTWEKMPESTFYQSVSATVRQWEGLEIRDYTATESICLKGMAEGEGTRYVMFIELAKYGTEVCLTQEQIKQFDEHLCEGSELYRCQRQKGSISTMHVIQVQLGGFQKLKYHILGEIPTMQFKMPRVLRRREHIEFLLKVRLSDRNSSTDGAEE